MLIGFTKHSALSTQHYSRHHIRHMQTAESKSLPQNAYVTLGEGEAYEPMVLPQETPPETTFRSIAWGVSLCVIFTVASAYSGLKVGQVMEAAIPIAILA